MTDETTETQEATEAKEPGAVPDDPVLAGLIAAFPGSSATSFTPIDGPAQDVVTVSP